MSIPDLQKKIKNITLPANPEAGEEVSFDNRGNVVRFPLLRKLFLSIIIILVAVLSFGIGRLSTVGNREPVRIDYTPEALGGLSTTNNQASTIQSISEEEVVVSKNGSKYHYKHCSGANQIKEENKIIFPDKDTAERSGYTLAGNCIAP